MRKIKSLIMGILFFLSVSHLFVSQVEAGYCKVIGEPECVESGNKDIGGFSVYKSCWRYRSKYECYNDNYIDYCKSISKIPGCEEVANTCHQYFPGGECDNSEKIYRCGNKLVDAENTVYLDSDYSIARDEKDVRECKEHIINRDCELVEEKCVEGKETRVINGYEVTKDCWKWDRKYTCITGSKVSDCQEYEKKCKLVEERCLSEEGREITAGCHHIEKTYECLEITGQLPKRKKCKKIGYCIAGNCEDVDYPENKNMPKAIAYLYLLKQMGDELKKELCDGEDLSKCEVFKGEQQGCRKQVIGFRNCCAKSGGGWGVSLKIRSCSPKEKMLAERDNKGLCYKVGTYCSEKTKFPKICLTKKTNYCCFGSKLSRILHEEIREQLGIGWGSAKEPDCRALSIEELQKADWSKIDLSEFFGDALKSLSTRMQEKFNKDEAPYLAKTKAKEALENPDYNWSRRYGTEILDGDDKYKKAKRYKKSVEKSIKRPFKKKVEEKEGVRLDG